MAGRGLPVAGSTGVRLPSVRPSALLVTQSVFRSHDGTTCWGFTPTRKRSTTLNATGSITYTSFDFRFGTYTPESAQPHGEPPDLSMANGKRHAVLLHRTLGRAFTSRGPPAARSTRGSRRP